MWNFVSHSWFSCIRQGGDILCVLNFSTSTFDQETLAMSVTFLKSFSVVAIVFCSTIGLAQTTPGTGAGGAGSTMPSAKAPAPVDNDGAVKVAHVHFASPKNGATIKGPEVKLVFAVEGMKVAKAGDLIPGSGHHHLIIDGGPVEKGKIVSADATHIHYGQGQTETTIKLPLGTHKLTLQFADGKHESYGEMMSETITITVK
jgi:hypothetical protein